MNILIAKISMVLGYLSLYGATVYGAFKVDPVFGVFVNGVMLIGLGIIIATARR